MMTISTVMWHMDLEPSTKGCLRVAADLAGQFNAKLIGVAAADLPWSYLTQESATFTLIDALRSDIGKRLANAEQRFQSAMAQFAGQVEWRSAIDSPVNFIAHQARAADLVVVSANRSGKLLDSSIGQLDLGDLAMQAGRPVLIVPPEVGQLDLKCVLVAWKDTREARRAVNDALPLLRKAQDVVVAEVIEGESARSSAHVRLDDVVGWLGRHGIAASARAFDFPEGRDPVDRLWQYGADLIVAGAYGHSRVREWVFGGFTDGFLRRSPQCVFLSH
jgi:nucleotide-binding universal stress UspA family protein